MTLLFFNLFLLIDCLLIRFVKIKQFGGLLVENTSDL